MVIVVAFLLSFVATGLQPIISKNEEVDKKKKILKSVVFVEESREKEVFTQDFVIDEYNNKIKELVVNYQGDPIEGKTAFELDVKKEFRKPLDERQMPVFVYNDDGGKKYYIVPLIGMGLWDEISGYIALEDDMSTIKGAAFDHKGETPGLGAEISKTKFSERFIGEEIFGEDGEYQFQVLKGTGNLKAEQSTYYIDGLSGATLTIDGVNNMMNEILTDYTTFFDKVKSSS
ncbi:MAG: NADH:ubiquinone reductase (Na(+)-transporting) subunit C [Chitinophagales bacterium]|nr:NADH:ubiquinone reductase (Na(+)-transporting) subunit C [Chitinophagales bacterium]